MKVPDMVELLELAILTLVKLGQFSATGPEINTLDCAGDNSSGVTELWGFADGTIEESRICPESEGFGGESPGGIVVTTSTKGFGFADGTIEDKRICPESEGLGGISTKGFGLDDGRIEDKRICPESEGLGGISTKGFKDG